LNDGDAILISQALKRNLNLKILDLVRNNFTSIGVKALLNCVFDSSSLNAISESNCTLVRMNIFSSYNDLESKNFDNCIKKMLELDWADKILLAMQDKDSLLKYLANVPAETHTRSVEIPSTGCQSTSAQKFEYSVFNNALVEYAHALLVS
jgi:hypothetical protein